MPPKRAYKKRRAPRRRRGMARKPLVKLMKTVAVKVQNAGLETKYVTSAFNNITFNSGITGGVAECYSLIPPITTGPGTWQKVGNDITPIRVKNTFICSLTGEAARSMNIIVDVFCLIMKPVRYIPSLGAALTLAGGLRFLRSGNSGQTALYNGYNTDGLQQINKEQYTLLKHFRFQLVNNVGYPNGDTTSNNAPNVAGQSMKQFSYIVDTPKQYRYDPQVTLSDYPQGHAPFWVAGYSHADGTAPDVLNRDLNISFFQEMIYKDA